MSIRHVIENFSDCQAAHQDLNAQATIVHSVKLDNVYNICVVDTQNVAKLSSKLSSGYVGVILFFLATTSR